MAFELDKEQFGVFLSTRRREKGYTQKDLANRLFVSDKAVSKWERGQSLPDISLLVPLAECLDVTVTELLEGQRLGEASLPAGQVEELLKRPWRCLMTVRNGSRPGGENGFSCCWPRQ